MADVTMDIDALIERLGDHRIIGAEFLRREAAQALRELSARVAELEQEVVAAKDAEAAVLRKALQSCKRLFVGIEIAHTNDPRAACVEGFNRIQGALASTTAGADLLARMGRMREALLRCSDLNIPFPDPALPGGNTDLMRGVTKGHEEARDYTSKIVRAALADDRGSAGADSTKAQETG